MGYDHASMGLFRKDLIPLRLSQEEKQAFQKSVSCIKNEVRKESIPELCPICKQPLNSACLSHTIPRYCLKEIAEEGMLFSHASIVENDLFKPEVGVKEAITFRMICRKCDTEFFKLYETPGSLYREPTTQIMGQIAAKNTLRELAKNLKQEKMRQMIAPEGARYIEIESEVRALDRTEDEKALDIAIAAGRKPTSAKYYTLMYHRVLPYVAPFAFQQMIVPVADFEGAPINQVFNYNPSYRIEPLHACVLPSEGMTAIIMFRRENAKRYRAFEGQFRSLSSDEKLEAIVKLIFAYSEDVVISKKVDLDIMKSESLREIARLNNTYIHFNIDEPLRSTMVRESALYDFTISRMPAVPNLLLPEYAIRQ